MAHEVVLWYVQWRWPCYPFNAGIPHLGPVNMASVRPLWGRCWCSYWEMQWLVFYYPDYVNRAGLEILDE